MKGRKPIPAGIKALKGNPGKRKPPKAAPPASWPGRMRCPRGLSETAKRAYHCIHEELKRLNLLATCNEHVLELYAATYDRWHAAHQHVRKEGDTVVTAQGEIKPSPWLAVADKEQDRLVKLLAEMGLTPVSRQRVGPVGETQSDPLSEFLKKAKSG